MRANHNWYLAWLSLFAAGAFIHPSCVALVFALYFGLSWFQDVNDHERKGRK